MLVDFYHLAYSPIEKVLPRICERLLEKDERLLVVGEADILRKLDEQLWSYAPEAFLPHGRSDAPGADKQPILLSEGLEPVNDARNVALADGVWREGALQFGRTFYFFNEAQLDLARGAWRTLRGMPEVEPRYWKQEGGKWVQGP